MRLAAEPDLSVVGEAVDSEAAINLALSLCPDIVLIDADMPHSQGIATAEKLHQVCPNTRVIILSIHDDALLCKRAQDAYAAAFVTKSLPADTLINTIRQVAQP
jgi:DNA-binding NarL/FixJ family response regulator